jgi:hypothetical protein
MPEDLKPTLDDFTAKVVNDPAKPQETLLLQGFLGASSQPDHTRVYSDLTLQSYVDVANTDIIHIEPISKDQSPMGGSYLWVKKDADVLPGTPTGPGTAKAKFLEGPIATEGAGASPAIVARPTVPIVACHPTIFVTACAPSLRPGSCITEAACPTRNPCFVGTAAACQIPNPTINEVTPQVQQVAAQPVVHVAQPAQLAVAAQPQFGVGGTAPSVACPTWFCPPPQTAPFHCVLHTPNCPQVAHHTVAPVCHQTVMASVCIICPTHGCTQVGPECPMHTPLCPQEAAPVAVAAPRAMVAPAAGPATVAPAQCVATAVVALCAPTPLHNCPTQLCPTPLHHCPSVSGFDCPSVNRFHCPSVAGFDCPSVNEFHCPSVNNFECPPKTSAAAHCPPTPNIQHCPTPNMICQTHNFNCPGPSVLDVCQTAGPHLC